jgi:hypothetical protein
MVIKASAASEIRDLVRALAGTDEVKRETAIARLAVIGTRAVPHILDAYEGEHDRTARVAMLRALEPLADRRSAPIARAALAQGGDLAIAAIAVFRELLDSRQGRTGADALDLLMSAALDDAFEHRVRLAARQALQHLPEVRRTLTEALRPDRAGNRLESRSEGAISESAALWHDALDGRLPDEARDLRAAVNAHASGAPLGVLQKLIDRIRIREEQLPVDARTEWRAVRGAVHQALAFRGSRVALYDLRETLERSDAELPGTFLAAVQLVGDRECLEALAAAYDRARPDDERWRAQLGTAFRAVAARERLTGRHAVIKRIRHRWPDAARALIEP